MAVELSDAELRRWLDEDVRYGDLTTSALGIGERGGHMTFAARGALTLCGVEEAARLLELCGCQCGPAMARGTAVPDGTLLLTAHGSAAALHRGWKTAQTLVEYASGIAAAAAAIVAAANSLRDGAGNPLYGPAVVCTRKNFPGTRALAMLAIRAGGASPHRLGLSETLLVFAEHRVFLAGELGVHLARLKRHHPEKKVMVEVSDGAEALAAARAGADIVQLEKFTPAQCAAVAFAFAELARRPLLAAGGGVDAGNAAAYAAAGADVLVTSAPYFAAPAQVQVRIGV